MPLQTAIDLLDLLRRCRLVEPARLDELARAPAAEPKALARDLVQRGWLTPYQVNQLFTGRGPDLLLGSYVLLEKLGEGGMGQVFRASNWKLGRVVAVKVIRKERLANPDAVRRFQREIRAAAQLDHPHIVRAQDADEVGGTHLLVMDYVEGTDLAKLVKKGGPLPVAQACDCARQAAMGLQHAFERGMVHRDVKPQNLLLSTNGIVKILDMGLARLGHADEAGEGTSTMTQEGAVMGTVDYIAPEQAMDSHTVDIRADLYSLGCTLYFLLTGRAPFPGGTAMEKLYRHQSKEPVPVEQVRPGVPLGVGAVVRKLMAKQPAARYQTPAEAADALAAAPTDGAAPAPVADLAETVAFPVGAAETTPQPALEKTVDDGGAEAVLRRAAERRRRLAAEQRRRIVAYAAGGFVSLALAVLFVVLFVRFLAPPTLPTPSPGPGGLKTDPPRPVPFEQWLTDVGTLPPDSQAAAVARKLQERNPGFDGQAVPTIEQGVVVGLEFRANEVKDLTPLQALRGLKRLTCRGNGRDQCKLTSLDALKGLPLTSLDCRRTAVTDLTPLLKAPLTDLSADFSPRMDVDKLRSLPTLKTINGRPAGDFWKARQAFGQNLLGADGAYSYVAGVDGDAFQAWVDQAGANGYLPLFVNGFDAGGLPAFVSVAVKGAGGSAWEVRYDLTSDEYQKAFEDFAGRGYWPLSTSGYLSGGSPHFAAVWVASPNVVGWEARHFLNPRDYQNKLAVVRAAGSRPVFVSGFADGAGGYCFIALFIPSDGAPWQALHNLTAEQYLKAVAYWQEKGLRPAHVSAYDTADGLRFAGLFLKDGASGTARIGLTIEQLRTELGRQIGEGGVPASVAGYTEGGEVHYAAVWVKRDKP